MKKIILSLGVIVVFLAYAWHQKNEADQVQIIPPSTSPTSVPTGSILPTMASQQGRYKNGQYTGSVADAFYGNIQVQVVITGEKISDVLFLQYPNDRGTSIAINTQAMPYLKQEAIAVQNANVDIVSGATDSSLAFRQSLGSALAQAK